MSSLSRRSLPKPFRRRLEFWGASWVGRQAPKPEPAVVSFAPLAFRGVDLLEPQGGEAGMPPPRGDESPTLRKTRPLKRALPQKQQNLPTNLKKGVDGAAPRKAPFMGRTPRSRVIHHLAGSPFYLTNSPNRCTGLPPSLPTPRLDVGIWQSAVSPQTRGYAQFSRQRSKTSIVVRSR